MAKTKTRLHFARFEFKYVLPKDLRDEVERELQFFMELDPFVSPKIEQCYFVRSLYFDDPHYSAFYDKTDGVCRRWKFRLRTYTDVPDDGTSRFLELKGRTDNLVSKHRVIVNGARGNGYENTSETVLSEVLRGADEGRVRQQFEFEAYRKRLGPVALVDYYRRPYISKYDPEFRLTFDDRLCFTATKCLFPAASDRCRTALPGYTIMEVKFRYHLPSWFHRIIQSYELRRVSISKICRGLVTLGLAEDFS